MKVTVVDKVMFITPELAKALYPILTTDLIYEE
jgi:hypothetical protein